MRDPVDALKRNSYWHAASKGNTNPDDNRYSLELEGGKETTFLVFSPLCRMIEINLRMLELEHTLETN